MLKGGVKTRQSLERLPHPSFPSAPLCVFAFPTSRTHLKNSVPPSHLFSISSALFQKSAQLIENKKHYVPLFSNTSALFQKSAQLIENKKHYVSLFSDTCALFPCIPCHCNTYAKHTPGIYPPSISNSKVLLDLFPPVSRNPLFVSRLEDFLRTNLALCRRRLQNPSPPRRPNEKPVQRAGQPAQPSGIEAQEAEALAIDSTGARGLGCPAKARTARSKRRFRAL